MKNKNLCKVSNIIPFLVLTLVLSSCASKNKLNNNVDNNQIVISKINTNTDKNTDIMFLSTIYFDFDSYILKTESKQNLGLLARYLKDTNNIHKNVALSGYCDELGTDEYNNQLGLKRAEETKKYLISLGVEESRISTISYGKSKQTQQFKEYKTKEESEEVRKYNRKVIINLE